MLLQQNTSYDNTCTNSGFAGQAKLTSLSKSILEGKSNFAGIIEPR